MRNLAIIITLLLALTASSVTINQVEAKPLQANDPGSLIAAVNALRASHGLPAYAENSILMSLAQQHAQYMADTGSVVHTDASGARPFQRALAAGYPLAGDLTLGGFYSENISAGLNESIDDAVTQWQGDAAHLGTMMSADLTQIGAGVAAVGNYYYYDIDAARPTGGPVVIPTGVLPSGGTVGSATEAPNANPTIAFTIPNTPAADGSITHIVQPGETLWTIAIAYKIPVDAIQLLNKLQSNATIYPGEKLIIRLASTTTPTSTTIATELPTVVEMPFETWTPLSSPTTFVEPKQATSTSSGVISVGVIVLAAFVLAGVLARGGKH